MRRLAIFFCLVMAFVGFYFLLHSRHIASATQATKQKRPQSNQALVHEAKTLVPFVGCEADGQTGPIPAPRGDSKVIDASASIARQLAYYEFVQGFGVFAPRGWYCFGTYGSDGSALYVSPNPIRVSQLFSSENADFLGPFIELSRSSGDTSGRFAVARTIARVFPVHQDFARRVIEERITPAAEFPLGPYPQDQLQYKSNSMVEFVTPAGKKGLGTDSRLKEDQTYIRGVALLVEPDTDLVQLSIRLPSSQQSLGTTIIEELEAEFANKSIAETQASEDILQTNAPESVPPMDGKGFPVTEQLFVNAYVLANLGRDDLNQNQLAILARDEYRMAKTMDTKTVLAGGEFMGTRGQRAMNYLYKLSQK